MFKTNIKTTSLINAFLNGATLTDNVYLDGCKPKTINTVCKNKIFATEYGHSLLVELPPVDFSSYLMIEEEAKLIIPKGIEFVSKIKDHDDPSIFLKLSLKDEKFVCVFKPEVLVEGIEDSWVQSGATVLIKYVPNVWINFGQKTGGVYLKVQSVSRIE